MGKRSLGLNLIKKKRCFRSENYKILVKGIKEIKYKERYFFRVFKD